MWVYYFFFMQKGVLSKLIVLTYFILALRLYSTRNSIYLYTNFQPFLSSGITYKIRNNSPTSS